VPVSDLAAKFGVQPSQIHLRVWQVLEHAENAFERSAGAKRDDVLQDRRIEQLQPKLADKNEVIAELMHEHVVPKKELGEL
jgi:transposase